jgi:hypothetical protein
MTQNDFNSAFKSLAMSQLPPAPDAHQLAMQLIHRDRRRFRFLAFFSVFFWLLATAGMLLLVYGLNRFVIFIRISQGMPWSSGATTQGSEAPRDMMFWGTDAIHHGMPFIAGAVAAFMLAALCTVLLIFSSRQATLNRINLSLAQLAEQVKQMNK